MAGKPTLDKTILRVLGALDGSKQLSLQSTVPLVRAEFPDLDIDDPELAELIARHAIAHGLNVIAFDMPNVG